MRDLAVGGRLFTQPGLCGGDPLPAGSTQVKSEERGGALGRGQQPETGIL